MSWCRGHYCNGKRCYSQAVQNNGDVVEVSKNVYTESVNQTMASQNCCIDPNDFGRCRFKVSFDSCKRSDEVGTAKCDTGGYSDYLCSSVSSHILLEALKFIRTLPYKVKPACHPGDERSRLFIRCQHGRPEIRPSTSRMRRSDLRHAQAYERSEEAHYQPSNGHNRWPSCVESIQEQSCDTGNHRYD